MRRMMNWIKLKMWSINMKWAVWRGNRTLDVILAEKNDVYAEKHNIQMTIMADGKALEFMSTADIAALFGNALDNAIECEYTIEDKEKKMHNTGYT